MLCRNPTAVWDLKALLLSRIQYEISKFGFWTPCLGGNEMDLHEDGGNSVMCGMETCQAQQSDRTYHGSGLTSRNQKQTKKNRSETVFLGRGLGERADEQNGVRMQIPGEE